MVSRAVLLVGQTLGRWIGWMALLGMYVVSQEAWADGPIPPKHTGKSTPSKPFKKTGTPSARRLKASSRPVLPPCPPHLVAPPPCKARPLPSYLQPLSFPSSRPAVSVPAVASVPAVIPLKITPPVGPKDPDVTGLLQYLRKRLSTDKIPGIAVSVVDAKRVFFAGGIGFRDLEKQAPVGPRTLFAIGSNTKAFTATALAMLVDRKKLRWDKPIRSYLSDFRLHDEYATQKLNTIDLLAHRSGLPRHDLVWYGSPLDRKALYRRLRFLRPSVSFRGLYQYQNLMYMTAGVLVEKLSGRAWEDFVRDEILRPLEMHQSYLSARDYAESTDKAVPYTYNESKKAYKALPFRNIDAIGPAGSILSNAEDMARWLQFQLNYSLHRKKPLLTRQGFWMLHTPHSLVPASPYLARFPELSYMSYGMGWLIMRYRGERMLFHTGGIDGFTAVMAFLPQRNIGLVLLTNKGGYGRILPMLWEAVDVLSRRKITPWTQRFDALGTWAASQKKQQKQLFEAKRIKNAPPTRPFSAYAGVYKHPAYGTIRIEQNKGRLLAHHHISKDPFPLQHYHDNVFHLASPETNEPNPSLPVHFHLSTDGSVGRLTVPLEPALKKPISFRRVQSPPKTRK